MIGLVGKEMRMILRSLVFYVFVLVACFFYFTEYAAEQTWSELAAPSATAPQNMGTKEHPLYGWKLPGNSAELAKRMRTEIGWDLNAGSTTKLRIGFLVESKLDKADKAALTTAVSALDSILQAPDKHTVEDVLKISDELNTQLGGNSKYKRGFDEFDSPIESYEEAVTAQKEAMVHYNEKVEAGELLPGAARYFSDYLSLPAGIFPVFLSAFLLLRDRSSRMSELIYSRRVSPWTYVGSKFFALGIMLSIVYLVLAVAGGWQTVNALDLEGQTFEAIIIFLGYTAWWLLPTVWTAIAFGMFGSMLFRRAVAPIALQIVWWFISVLPLMGSYGLYRLFIRFNSPDDYDLYRQWAGEIALNRSFYLLLALLLTAGAALLWERNRSRTDSGRGRSKTTAGRKGKAEAAA
ncbi:ABC transporter permease [Paenibacillus ihuae]|uniref:ABC transporter permease n=1 Tax=Paenibacillus ihuae TaxID=1232431 RepID=UPI0006D545C3|nr:ABC transporter permease [Paenibacillus ihuae]